MNQAGPQNKSVNDEEKESPHFWQCSRYSPAGKAKSPAAPGAAHSCPKSVLKKVGGREAKLRRKKKTKMEIEFWDASY